MADKEKHIELFEKVLHDLKDFLPYLVLVGGWVPFLYSQYVWKIRHKPVATVDIDFGFQDIPYKGKITIASRIRQQNYGEHHFDMGRLYPFVPIAQLGKSNIKADVEFITSPETSKALKIARATISKSNGTTSPLLLRMDFIFANSLLKIFFVFSI